MSCQLKQVTAEKSWPPLVKVREWHCAEKMLHPLTEPGTPINRAPTRREMGLRNSRVEECDYRSTDYGDWLVLRVVSEALG
jgi:hypothetical protein